MGVRGDTPIHKKYTKKNLYVSVSNTTYHNTTQGKLTLIGGQYKRQGNESYGWELT